ncbi:hypothetical protein [Psychrobium sp. 1_MG-2023]|uniref:hypothetical protein n=1 Tax=Psychrobium sp. 1_MG-2023 TaxID=3062624 RepID=UPI0012910CEB|nr:hypothetical protein [Psychrobium sp. 1_MG-2023]MDP2562800.1 hypothetical protein [Psychrobium sp. 1_MG-2023]
MKKLLSKGVITLPPLSAFSPYREKARQSWHTFNTAQRFYISALLLIISSVIFSAVIPSWLIPVMDFIGISMAIIGLSLEFWPLFLRFWNSLPGKAVIVTVYAFIGNFALVSAAGLVNEITGVSAESLPYSHNFSVLISLPTWIIVTSFIGLLVVNAIMPLYLFLLLLLKPFGVHRMLFAKDYRFPMLTLLVRCAFTIVISINFFAYATNFGLAGDEIQQDIIKLAHKVEQQQKQQEISDSGSSEETQPGFSVTLDAPLAQGEERVLEPTSEAMAHNNALYQGAVRQLLSYFIYHYEADSFSRCQHTEGAKIVELNDYEILEITKIQGKDSGYSYEVKKCISPAFK